MTGSAMRTANSTTRLALLALLALCAGCLYRMPVQQGNQLDPTQIEQLTTGMTRTQVTYLLGTPMVPPGFNNDRWDYYHYLDTGRGEGRDFRRTQRLTVWFKDDKVDRIENGGQAAPAGGAAAAPAAASSQGS
jgi:outer membrane protein assembly factor BamE